MKRLTILLIWIIGVTNSHAQVRITAVSQQFQTLPAHLSVMDTLDITRCVVYYRYFYPVDNFSGGFSEAEDLLTLQIGRTVSKTFSHDLYLWDRNLTYGEKKQVPFPR